MKCPHCNHLEDHVIDSRPVETANVIRRRRECLSCHKRYTTYERCETIPLMVLKSDDRREPFDRNKLRSGITLACKKRHITAEQIEQLLTEVELELQEKFVLEAPSRSIGELVLEKLKALDPVAYIRFVSVYRQFSDAESFVQELKDLKAYKKQLRKRDRHKPSLTPILTTYSEN